jgi:hypothetical protein
MQSLEQSVLTALEADTELTAGVKIQAWPDAPAAGVGPLGAAVLMVRFAGLSLNPPLSQGRLVQEGSAEVELRLLVKDLRSHTGAYPLLSRCHSLLSGLQPSLDPGFSPKLPGLYLLTSELVERYRDIQVWDWGARYRVDLTYAR